MLRNVYRYQKSKRCRLVYVEDEENHTYVTLPMSKKDLASYLGTTPETISRKFSSLEERGLIKQHTQKYVEIFDLDKLLFASS